MHLSLLSVGIDQEEPIILLCPQSDERHAWQAGYWPALLRLLAEERAERLVVLGADGLTLPTGVIQVAPVRESLTLAALLAHVALVIAPDTGTLHLADLLGIPAIGLYGPSSPDTSALPNAHHHALCHREFTCHPCRDVPCQERHCMRALKPAEVCAAVLALLDRAVVLAMVQAGETRVALPI